MVFKMIPSDLVGYLAILSLYQHERRRRFVLLTARDLKWPHIPLHPSRLQVLRHITNAIQRRLLDPDLDICLLIVLHRYLSTLFIGITTRGTARTVDFITVRFQMLQAREETQAVVH